jgi:hypothetical protein
MATRGSTAADPATLPGLCTEIFADAQPQTHLAGASFLWVCAGGFCVPIFAFELAGSSCTQALLIPRYSRFIRLKQPPWEAQKPCFLTGRQSYYFAQFLVQQLRRLISKA